ncbi:DEHA2C06798p [Debaryomyces hansenii CBS767]|uniref:THO complex subunit 2 n=1 Tax=Debaryomyces hansenii (strain ATCC 36239 / CBS 767 / BCRC 21394 / JCM 1990 / NBRC 0083 / IGC 2968) TaxID=284592 RepID=B5RT85_DEBHA|nr:DEHA2C06798p [Debaryomyces hansenii CBS767]CAR65547.1 DEHA2C06798p [Debaryomyces hansenii CBS767]|eukprot:XP_002770182.1 DEHA2C06798p [Debaryomyces hansenii CBS767]
MSTESEALMYFDDKVINEFEGVGSESLIQLLQAPDQTSQDTENVTSQIFTELLLVYEEEKITLEAIIQFLSLAIKDEFIAVIFCQVFDVFPLSVSLQKLLLEIHQRQNIIKASTFSKMIGHESISKSSIVPTDTLMKQLNTHKRDEFYTQKKYNLIHEESEGYAKLMVEIYNILKYSDTSYQVDYALRIIEELTGHYNLDPNRTLDILIELYSNNFVGNQDFAIDLLRKSQWWPSEESDCFSSMENLSQGGNETAAKIIGLRISKQPLDKDLPETLKILFACLIKEGFVSFGSIYKYVTPGDEEMKALEADYKKQLNEKIFKASASALALASPLQEDEEDEHTSKDKKPSSQGNPKQKVGTLQSKLNSNLRFQLLRVFLGNGLYWPSIYILTEYPFLAYVDDEINELINRLFSSMLAPLYGSIKVFSDEELDRLQTSKQVAFSRPFNNVRYEESPCTELLSFKPTIKSFTHKRFHYFYTNWNKKIPQINNPDDLFKISKEFLKFNGVNLAKDLELFSKICEIGVWDLNKNQDNESRKHEWLHYFRNFIFPAMPLIEENSIIIDKAYSILSFYDSEDRFNLYSEMHQVLAKNNPLIKIAYGKAEKSTKDVLKRLSKENVRPMMRRLAKISFSNPLPCFLTILQQIESYDNLNTLVVETARYFNNYGWDTLTLAILMRLTASGRSNIQDDGLNERQWIQSLASFIGKICHRYPNAIDLKTLITFLLKSLHNKENVGLIVLREIFICMGGIQTIADLTLRQIDMINCGSSLEKVVYRTIDDLRFERFKSGHILVKTLVELDAVNELLILLCQLGDDMLFNSDQSHLKVLANKSDDLSTVLHLFTQLINFFGNSEDLAELLLPVSEFTTKYHVPPSFAFEIWRQTISKRILAATDSDDIFNPVLSDIMSQSSQTLSSKAWDYLSTGLYATFWQLSLYDINYTEELYDAELEKLKSNINSIKDTLLINKRNSEVSRISIDKYKKDLKQNEDFVSVIPEENESHLKHYELISKRLTKESSHWFTMGGTENIKSQVQSFFQYCLLPRAIHSSFDAAYSAKFLFQLHKMEATNFSIIIALNELIKSNILFGTLFTSTPAEAENLGLFFAELLKRLHAWSNESTFNAEAKNSTLFSEADTTQELTYDIFRKLLFEYHDIILKDVGKALEVKEYMCRRNAITFLKYLVGIYPNVEDHCEKIVTYLENIALNEEREDLKLSSSALIGHVKSRSKYWVPLWEFIPMDDEEKEAHVQKRNAIKENIKKLEQESKDRIKEKELKEKLMREKELSEKKNHTSTISYDESKSTSSRPGTRTSDSAKTRYDYYSKYGENKVKSQPKDETSTGAQKVAKVENEVAEKSKQDDKKENSKQLDLKARIREAKKELKESHKSNSTPVSKEASPASSNESINSKDQTKGSIPARKPNAPSALNAPNTPNTPNAPNAPNAPKAQSNSRLTEENRSKSRTPLPPQDIAAQKDTQNDSRYNEKNQQFGGRRYNENYNSNRYNQRSYTQNNQQNRLQQKRPIPPPPSRGPSRPIPPPPPPPAGLKLTNDHQHRHDNQGGRNNGRYDTKRKHDTYNSSGRGYDKKPRY